MNNAQMSARVGLFFLIGVALVWVTYESLGSSKLSSKNAYTLIAQFKNLKELKAGDDVRMAGVKIGVVSDTRLTGRQAEALLLIEENVQVAKDTKATIAMAGLLGSNYVSLDLGTETAGFFAAGEIINSEDTPDLNSMIAQIGEIGRKIDAAIGQFSGAIGGEGGVGGGLFAKVEKLVDENQVRIGEITTNLQDITSKVNRGEGTLGKLINDPAGYERLLAAADEIRAAATETKTFITGAQGLIDQVKSGEGTLGTLLYDEESGANIKVVAKNLREISDKLNQGQGTLGKLINDETLFLDAQSTLRKVDRAVDGLADQGPITAVGAAANALF
jgi:phospholipid/cholesterol/gamma-HCH transport system substrate-binding protein